MSGSQLRQLKREQLVELGEQGLRDHLFNTAVIAHQRYVPLDGKRILKFLQDNTLVRHPVRLAYELGTMAAHQFAQPEPEPVGDGYVLYVHPSLQRHEDDLVRAVLYFIPLINYGALVSDDHCLVFGATVLGLTLQEYYEQLCVLAESIGVSVA